MQLSFNMGVLAHGLELSKEDGFDALAKLREGTISTDKFRAHIAALVEKYEVPIQEENILRPF